MHLPPRAGSWSLSRGMGIALLVAVSEGCGAGVAIRDPLPQWSFAPAMIFPADQGLTRPEDGVALPDGRLIVTDQIHGLQIIEPDGSHRPFGSLVAAGYSPTAGAANGVSLESDGAHLIVSDAVTGGIYRVNVASGEATLIHRHRFGVNAARRDRSGAIWFTQSTENSPAAGEGGLFAAVDIPVANGALLRLPFRDGRFATEAEVVVSGLYFANGLVLDELRNELYVAETTADRVLRYRYDAATGRVDNRTTAAEVPAPDNLELDPSGRLWVTLPVRSEVVVVDPRTGVSRSVFRVQSAEQEAIAADFIRRRAEGRSRIELLTPALWSPLPGPVTGVILTSGIGPVYITGLGNALLRLPR